MLITLPLSSGKLRALKLSGALLLVVGIVTVGAAPGRRATNTPAEFSAATGMNPAATTPVGQTVQPVAFSVTWKHTVTAADGQSRVLLTTKRDQRSDGLFKLVHTFHARDGATSRAETYFGYMGLGTFRLDEARRRLVFAAPMLDERAADIEAALRDHPRYDREEDVRGQRCVVWRTPAERGGPGYREDYRAPALGGLLVKRVEVTPNGREETMEPTDLQLGEPDGGLFAELSQYRVDYTHFERKIGEMARRGDQESLPAMREGLRRMRAARPDAR